MKSSDSVNYRWFKSGNDFPEGVVVRWNDDQPDVLDLRVEDPLGKGVEVEVSHKLPFRPFVLPPLIVLGSLLIASFFQDKLEAGAVAFWCFTGLMLALVPAGGYKTLHFFVLERKNRP